MPTPSVFGTLPSHRVVCGHDFGNEVPKSFGIAVMPHAVMSRLPACSARRWVRSGLRRAMRQPTVAIMPAEVTTGMCASERGFWIRAMTVLLSSMAFRSVSSTDAEKQTSGP